tara:strand:- start:98 stop:340 length:243 start_codon:yes stop_codon:yes gene_type:complete
MRAVKKRNYKDEYQKFQAGGVQKKRRALRNKNRRRLEAGGRVSKGDGMDIHHVGNSIKVMTASQNRGIAEKSRLPGSKRK